MTISTSSLVKSFVDDEKARTDVKIDPTRLSEGMADQADLFSWYASQSIRAKYEWDNWKRKLELLEARLGKKYRIELVVSDDKGKVSKPTEPQIKEAVYSDASYQVINQAAIDAEYQYRLSAVWERAFEQRKDMVINIGKIQLKEADGQVRSASSQATTNIIDDARKRYAAKDVSVTEESVTGD